MAASIEKEIAEFEKDLFSFLETKLPISGSKIAHSTKLAIKHAKHYKHVVHVVEKFFAKSSSEYKLYGVYVIDSICRQAKREKDEKIMNALIGRFEAKLDGILGSISKLSPKEFEKIKRITSLWLKNKIFEDAAWVGWCKKHPLLFDSKAIEAPQQPNADTLAGHLAKINENSSMIVKGPDPLAFDYGDDTDGEINVGSNNNNNDSSTDLLNDSNSSGLPPALASILSAIPSSITNIAQSAPAPAIQTQFTSHQQQQLASLLAAQGFAVSSTPATPNDPRNMMTTSSMPSSAIPAVNINASLTPAVTTIPREYQNIPRHPANPARIKQHDPSLELDQIKILTRTLYIGGLPASATKESLETIFHNYCPEHVGVYLDKFHAFVRLQTRDYAEKAKRDFWNNKVVMDGEQLRINWACGTGKKDTFDRRQGFSIANVYEYSESERQKYMVEVGLDFLEEHTRNLQQLFPEKLEMISRPYNLGGICLEEPDNPTSENVGNKRSSSDDVTAENTLKRIKN